LPELPRARFARFCSQYGLSEYDAGLLVEDPAVADYFEAAVRSAPEAPPKALANWITGELFGLLKQSGQTIQAAAVRPEALADLVRRQEAGQITGTVAKQVLAEMYASGRTAEEIIAASGLEQISDSGFIARLVEEILSENPQEVATYLAGKETVAQWFFGQVMRAAGGRANPQVVQSELVRRLNKLKYSQNKK